VIVVGDNGLVENRVIEVPLGMSVSTLVEAGNYLTARLAGRSFAEARSSIAEEIAQQRSQLGELTEKVVSAGLAMWGGSSDERDGGFLIVRGHAKLLEDVTNLGDLERIRGLFAMLEARQSILKLVELTQSAKGMQIFIGSESQLFGLSGCAMIVAPYTAGAHEAPGAAVVGAIGVIGPTRMNYARIIPLVDYTARVVSRLLGTPDKETRR
jgi:heat-inducible transcriptional repressor